MVKENFNKLIFNPFGLSDEELIEQVEQKQKLYEVLGAEKGIMGSFHTSKERRAKQIRYLLYLYDKHSPLWISDPDIKDRKKKAASLAGYDILNDKKKTLDEIFLLSDPHLAKSVSSFIRYQNSATLSSLITDEHVLYELEEAILQHLDDFKDDKQMIDHYKVKLDLTEKKQKLLELINKNKYEIWQDDKEAEEITMDLEFGRKVTPEQIAMIPIKKPEFLR